MGENGKKVVDWVKERAACDAYQMYEKLKLDIEHDIKVRNEQIPENKRSYYSFGLTESYDGFTVIRKGSSRKAVAFFQEREEIIVKKGDSVLFNATVTLNDEGECVFKVKGYELESWKVRQMALEDLFFEPI